MMQICTWSNWYRCGYTKPAFRKRVFTIITSCTLSTITGSLVFAQLIMSDVGISVANGHTVV